MSALLRILGFIFFIVSLLVGVGFAFIVLVGMMQSPQQPIILPIIVASLVIVGVFFLGIALMNQNWGKQAQKARAPRHTIHNEPPYESSDGNGGSRQTPDPDNDDDQDGEPKRGLVGELVDAAFPPESDGLPDYHVPWYMGGHSNIRDDDEENENR